MSLSLTATPPHVLHPRQWLEGRVAGLLRPGGGEGEAARGGRRRPEVIDVEAELLDPAVRERQTAQLAAAAEQAARAERSVHPVSYVPARGKPGAQMLYTAATPGRLLDVLA